MKAAVWVFFCFFVSSMYAQKITLSGSVYDFETGERLIGAAVYEPISRTGTVTNNYGFYSLTLPKAKTLSLTISYLGYETVTEAISALENQKMNIPLLSQSLKLNEVELVARKKNLPIQERTEMSTVSIPIKNVKMMPALGGESDILKALQLMPGVQSGSEGSSGLYVRGGGPDQNLILLDDVPLYYVNHLGGFVSTFNTDAINTVKLIKGGFPANYGGRLSSILDIRMKMAT